MQMLKILLLTVGLALHPVHVTLLSIEYSADDHVFNGFLKVYYDDFLLDFRLLTGNAAVPDLKGTPEEAKKMIAEYINGKVTFIEGKKKIPAEIKDIDLSGNELRMNLKFIVKKKAVRYEIINSILTDIYKDQSNLLIFRCDDFEEAIKLTSENNGHVFNVK
jgi:hypothetical protein